MKLIYLMLTAPLLPLFKALHESQGEHTEKMQQIGVLYGYLVATGVAFNVLVLIAFLLEIFK